MADRPKAGSSVQGEPRNSHGPGGLSFRKAFSGDRCMLSLEGELRHGNADDLYDEVVRLYESGVSDLVLDFRALNYCDTTGLQSLVRIYKYVQEYKNLKFVILVHEGELLDILRTCRFDKFMAISTDDGIVGPDMQPG